MNELDACGMLVECLVIGFPPNTDTQDLIIRRLCVSVYQCACARKCSCFTLKVHGELKSGRYYSIGSLKLMF